MENLNCWASGLPVQQGDTKTTANIFLCLILHGSGTAFPSPLTPS